MPPPGAGAQPRATVRRRSAATPWRRDARGPRLRSRAWGRACAIGRAPFERREHVAGALDDRARQSGQPGHVNAVAARRGTVGERPHEHDFAVGLTDDDVDVVQPRQMTAELDELVVVGREQGAAADARRGGARRPPRRSRGRRRSVPRPISSSITRLRGSRCAGCGRLRHLHHERGPPAGQVVVAPTRVKMRSHTPMRASRRARSCPICAISGMRATWRMKSTCPPCSAR